MAPSKTSTLSRVSKAANELADIDARPLAPHITAPSHERVGMFGCQIDRLRMKEAVARVYDLVDHHEGQCHYVVTPNVDHVVMLQHHLLLRQSYDNASLVVADGMPVVLASRLLARGLPERISGTDLVAEVFAAAESRGGVRVYLLGAMPGVALLAAQRITTRWPAVEIVGTDSPPLGFERDARQTTLILERIAASHPDILVIGLGAPKQELWVHRHRHAIEARVALCVGAAIDFLAGNKRRAPVWMQKWGLEWLHRVASEPRRLVGRYLRDAWRFPPIVWREWNKNRHVASVSTIAKADSEQSRGKSAESKHPELQRES